MKRARKIRQVAPVAYASTKTGRKLDAQEIPVFEMNQGKELQNFLAGRPYRPKETVVKLVRGGFEKDGVWVDPAGDSINGWGKSTACGCLYTWKDGPLKGGWPYSEVGPEDIVWQKAYPDWKKRHMQSDWGTLESDKPEVAPWLGREAA